MATNSIRTALHVPSGRLTQEDLDTFLECVDKMILLNNLGDRPIFLLLDNRKVQHEEFVSGDGTMDFVGRLHNDKVSRLW